MTDKRRKSLVDLRDYPAGIDLARKFYRAHSKLRQNHECREIAELLGMSHIAIWTPISEAISVSRPQIQNGQKYGRSVPRTTLLLTARAEGAAEPTGSPATTCATTVKKRTATERANAKCCRVVAELRKTTKAARLSGL